MTALVSVIVLGAVLATEARVENMRHARVDAVFAPYARPDTPGCAVGVSEAGRVVYAKGYGMADLAWGVPIAPDTRFDIASDAKQFTAFAAALLAERGALSLDDDVRKHVPELRDFGHRVTLRHMLGMRSGLPDILTLGTLTGRRGGSKLTPEVGLRLIRDVRSLDFPPDTDYAYSNTNYFLLGLVVERVSGKPLGEFLKAEAFDPASMRRTLYEPDPQPVVPGRATPYAPAKGSFLISPYPASDGGSKGVQSTVLDMLAWADALDSGRLAGVKLSEMMRAPGKLTTGEPLTYGMGLETWRYRGVPIVLHGGTGTGYRSQTLRFPTLGAAVSVLCNRSDANHDALARGVADAWLGDRLGPVPAPAPFGPSHRAAIGDYISDGGLVVELRLADGRASAEGITGEPLNAAGPSTFTFETGQRPALLKVRGDSTLLYVPGQGRTVVFRRYQTNKPSAETLVPYTGRYYSSDFEAGLSVALENGELRVLTPNGVVQPLRPTTTGRFLTGRTTALSFERGQGGRIERLVVSTPRARRVVFGRVR